MEKNDYFVIAYKILIYLYKCLKEDENIDFEYLSSDTKNFPVGERYWKYILKTMYEEGYLTGIALIPVLGQSEKQIKMLSSFNITSKEIEYLSENSMMEKAKQFLKEIKEIVPGMQRRNNENNNQNNRMQ